MPPKVSLYISSTLDGFIARADGAIDWLIDFDDSDTDYGYADYYDSVDGLLMGSATFEMIRSLGPWPYNGKPAFVFTRRELAAEERDIYFYSGDPRQVIGSREFSGLGKLWLVGGSSMIAACIRKDLIDEYIITQLPVVLGHGLRLFPSPAPELWLHMTDCSSYDRGVLQVRYERSIQETAEPPAQEIRPIITPVQ
jgi:dihydrofolate reductase